MLIINLILEPLFPFKCLSIISISLPSVAVKYISFFSLNSSKNILHFIASKHSILKLHLQMEAHKKQDGEKFLSNYIFAFTAFHSKTVKKTKYKGQLRVFIFLGDQTIFFVVDLFYFNCHLIIVHIYGLECDVFMHV